MQALVVRHTVSRTGRQSDRAQRQSQAQGQEAVRSFVRFMHVNILLLYDVAAVAYSRWYA